MHVWELWSAQRSELQTIPWTGTTSSWICQRYIELPWVSSWHPLFTRLINNCAIVLHPWHKLSYFKTAGWEQDWINTAEDLLQNKYEWINKVPMADKDGNDSGKVPEVLQPSDVRCTSCWVKYHWHFLRNRQWAHSPTVLTSFLHSWHPARMNYEMNSNITWALTLKWLMMFWCGGMSIEQHILVSCGWY